jgi:hypothetical protein
MYFIRFISGTGEGQLFAAFQWDRNRKHILIAIHSSYKGIRKVVTPYKNTIRYYFLFLEFERSRNVW